MKANEPKLKMPEGFPRLFVGDGKTPFKGPAMCKIKPVRDADEWQLADGDLYGKFSIKHVYALPALPRRVSVTAEARGQASNLRECLDAAQSRICGMMDELHAAREAIRGAVEFATVRKLWDPFPVEELIAQLRSCLTGAGEKVEPEMCQWIFDGDGLWKGSCGAAWCFNDGGPTENEMAFCPKCGKRVTVSPFELICDECGEKAADNYEVGDACACGGVFRVELKASLRGAGTENGKGNGHD